MSSPDTGNGTGAYHYVVVGAGLAGSATAWQLARRGCAVTLLEQATPAHLGGSSHGSARIFRYAYPDPFYARLVVRARRAWADLEAEAGVVLVDEVGAVDLGADRDPRALADVLAACGVEHELLTASQARARWPGVEVDGDVLWQPGAGVLDAQAAVLAMTRLAAAAGAVVREDWRVASISRAASGLEVVSSTGEVVSADRVVVAPGGWLPDLLSGLPRAAEWAARMPPLEVRQEQVFHFPYRDAPGNGAASWPTLIHKRPDIYVYALPGGRDAGGRGQKVAEFAGGKVIDSAAASDLAVDPVNRERVTAYVERFLPGLVPEPYAEATCLFTSTPTEDFVLDSIDGVTVVSPCSGHGAKFAPLIGALAADVAMGLEVDPVVRARFALAPPAEGSLAPATRGRPREAVTPRPDRA